MYGRLILNFGLLAVMIIIKSQFTISPIGGNVESGHNASTIDPRDAHACTHAHMRTRARPHGLCTYRRTRSHLRCNVATDPRTYTRTHVHPQPHIYTHTHT